MQPPERGEEQVLRGMRSEVVTSMRRRTLLALTFVLTLTAPALAQSRPIGVPNPMAAHTVFIIVITAAFLTWAASFSVQMMKERHTQRKGREALLHRKESVLNQITELEMAMESGTINEGQYKRRMKEMRGQLARVIGKLQPRRVQKKKPA